MGREGEPVVLKSIGDYIREARALGPLTPEELKQVEKRAAHFSTFVKIDKLPEETLEELVERQRLADVGNWCAAEDDVCLERIWDKRPGVHHYPEQAS